ncbi:MAG: DNA-binding protein [Clostridiales bacterium]|nr:DNA-binding protein [Clostridiales bacterium]
MSKNLEISVLLDYYGGMLTDKQRDVIDLYYNQDLSLAEIAEHEKISRQGVRDNIKRGEAYLTELEENLHLAKQTVSLLALLEDIQRRNREIYRINEESKYSSEIKEHAVAIEDMLKTFLKEYE